MLGDSPTTPSRGGNAARLAAAVIVLGGLAYASVRLGVFARSQVYKTGVGERRSVDLPDSSHVVVGPLSEMKVAGRYNHGDRRVDVVGQAWFDVRPDSSTPFHVYSVGTITEIRAGTFAIQAAASDSIVHVVVAEGSAAVRLPGAPSDQGAMLNANDEVELDARSFKAHILRNVNAQQMTAWRTGRLTFENVPLGTVTAELTRWYGVKIRFAQPDLANRPVSYDLPTDSLPEVLKILRSSMLLHFEQQGDTVVIR